MPAQLRLPRVALHLSGRLTERLAMKSIRSAIFRDMKWFATKATVEAGPPQWNSEPDARDAIPQAVPLVPWRELSLAWQRILATFDGLFESAEEEEQARQAFHEGGTRWRLLFMALKERQAPYTRYVRPGLKTRSFQ